MSLMNNSTPLGATQYTYDTMSRLATVSDGANTATYARIAGMNLLDTTTVSNTSGTVLTRDRNYDSYHRLASISNTAGSVTRSYTYTLNDKDQRTRITFADGSYWDYTYDAKGQVISGAKYDANGLAVPGQAFGYGYDEIGNMLYKENGMSALKIDYSSNIVNQYTAAVYPGVVPVVGAADVDAEVKVMRNDTPQNYYPLRVMTPTLNGKYYYGTFSADNSLTEKTVDYSVYAMKTDPNDTSKKLYEKQNGSFTVPKRDAAFTYDDDGNMLTNGDWTYEWNAENRMIAAEKSDQRLEYSYDYQGRRFSKKVYTGSTGNWILSSEQKFVYDGYLQIAEFDGSDALQKTYLQNGVILIAVTDANLSATYYYIYDGNKNVKGLVDSSGNLIAQYEYGPFGRILSQSGTYASTNPFRFSSEFHDDETELVYYLLRYYDAKIARWTKKDPVGLAGGYNLYGFVDNNPISSTDALGLWKRSKWTGKIKTFKGTACAEEGDTLEELAELITGDKSDSKKIVIKGKLSVGMDVDIAPLLRQLEIYLRSNIVAATKKFSSSFGEHTDRNNVDDYFNKKIATSTKCLHAAYIVMAKGLKDTIGANAYNKLINYHLNIDFYLFTRTLSSPKLMKQGDWGYINNHADYNANYGSWQGENIINTGYDSYWGHNMGNRTYKEWLNILEKKYQIQKKNKQLLPTPEKGKTFGFSKEDVSFYNISKLAMDVFDYKNKKGK